MMEPRQHGYFKIHNARIYYRIYGRGERTLFFLHGNGEDWTCFQEQIEYFAKDYQVITMDSRGHGQSGVSDKPLTIKQMARDTAVLIKKLQLETVTLVGFSDGGNIALEIAVNELVELDGLIIAGANLNPRGVKIQYQLPIILGHTVCKMLAKFNAGIWLKAQILGLMTHQPNMRVERLRKVKVPALVLAGEKDMIKTKHTRLIAAALRNSTLVIIPGVDHFIFNKNAEKVNQIMKSFLASDNKNEAA